MFARTRIALVSYFLKYVASISAGCFTVDGLNLGDALVKAKKSLRGLTCTNAVLLFNPHPTYVFGEGAVVAIYAPARGWRIPDSQDRTPPDE